MTPPLAVLSSFESEDFTTKIRLGKLPGAEAFASEFPARMEVLGFRELAISIEHGQRAGLLPGEHKDPFDRMLIAQAQAENLPIVSNEEVFDTYRVRRIW
jgi:PIN domain nuclease of toxin-antitoxin system